MNACVHAHEDENTTQREIRQLQMTHTCKEIFGIHVCPKTPTQNSPRCLRCRARRVVSRKSQVRQPPDRRITHKVINII